MYVKRSAGSFFRCTDKIYCSKLRNGIYCVYECMDITVWAGEVVAACGTR